MVGEVEVYKRRQTVARSGHGPNRSAQIYALQSVEAWKYNRELYKKRNEIERLFRRLKGFRRIFSRFEKLDVVFLAFLYFASIIEAPRVV